MKRRISLSIAFSFCIGLLALISSDSTANAAPPRTYIGDTGMITVGPNEFLRATAVNRSRVSSLTVTFTAQVTQSVCSGGVCTHTVVSETTTNPVALMPGQAASHDIMPTPSASAVRAIVRADGPDWLGNALIVDSTTGGTLGVYRLYGDCDNCG
jgi:hypothetical protein